MSKHKPATYPTRVLLGVVLLLSTQLAVAKMEAIDDEELSDISGEGVAIIYEGTKIDSPISGSEVDADGLTNGLTGTAGQDWNPDCTANGDGAWSNCIVGDVTNGGATGGQGLSMEFIVQDTLGAYGITNNGVTNGYAVSRFKAANIEVGDLDDTWNVANFGNYGNSMWDDPIMVGIEDNQIIFQMPGNLDYGTAGNLLGPDRVPTYGYIGNPNVNTRDAYGFVDPDINGGGTCAPARPGQYCFTDKGNVYRLPHEPDRSSDLSVNSWPQDALGNDYTVVELAPMHNWDWQWEVYSTAPGREGLNLGTHPKDPAAICQETVAGKCTNGQPVGDLGVSSYTEGYHRVMTVRIKGVHQGRTSAASNANPTGLNVFIWKPGGLSKAIYLPNHICLTTAYMQGGSGSSAMYTGARTHSGALANCSVDYSGIGLSTSAEGGVGQQVDDGYESGLKVSNGDNGGTITQAGVLSGTNFGFNGYPEGHMSYALRPDADSNPANDIPNYSGGVRTILEINHLRLDDIRMARSLDVSSTGSVAEVAPADAGWPDHPGLTRNANASIGGNKNLDVLNRELWITDVEIRDMRFGSFELEQSVDQNDPSVNPLGYFYPEPETNNEIAPLSMTFATDPYNGRMMEMFLPYHNAAAVGNDKGRISGYIPFIAPTPNGEGQCCGAFIIDGFQMDFGQWKLFLDPQ